jgi:RNA polymerase sigma factor (sigma-70 family)
MDCQQITEAPVALQIMQAPEGKGLQQLFHCIYSLFQGSFLDWIQSKYNRSGCKEKLREDAKDAFQNGILAFYDKARKKELTIKGSLKTVVYSFGLLQLLAFFKKEKTVYGITNYKNGFDLFFENDCLENERQELLNEKEQELLEVLMKLPAKQRDILFMKFFGKLKSKQIAEKLGVSAGNVDNEAAKAYKSLRLLLKPKYIARQVK